nr:glycosyltransferase [uncultured Blautia sp.]
MGKIVWIGSYVSNNNISRIQKFGYKNPASIISQANILEGLEVVTNSSIDTLGVLSFRGFPSDKNIFIPKLESSHGKDARDILAPIINIKYFNKYYSKLSLKKEVKKYFLNLDNKETTDVFIYEMRSVCLEMAKTIKRINPNIKTHLIIPDLPQFMDLREGYLKKCLKKLDWKNIQHNMKYIDDYILYTKSMAEYLKITDKKWMVMEGSINYKEIEESVEVDLPNIEDKVVIMYSGGIKKNFKIDNLLDTMSFLDDRFELWLTGSGDFEKTVVEYAEKNNRIKYFGFLSSHDKLKQLQKRATMLINMRDPEEEASKFCFPSKIFEYMLTGKPVVSLKLKGIPQEYFQYLIEVNSTRPEDIAIAIKKVADSDSKKRINFGMAARDFIIKEKNNISQAKRIYQFIR